MNAEANVATKVNPADATTQRARGEHASMASFAHVVLALMTHQAPPDLILDSLEAAQDEVRHAMVSFAQASSSSYARALDSEKPESPARVAVGPSTLPETTLHLRQDFIALAHGVAREGCIDETIAALELAWQAQQLHNDQESQLLASIANDEGRHAGLAWRTLRWICQTNETACKATVEMSGLFDSDHIRKVLVDRLSTLPQQPNDVHDNERNSAVAAGEKLFDFLVQCPQSCERNSYLSSKPVLRIMDEVKPHP